VVDTGAVANGQIDPHARECADRLRHFGRPWSAPVEKSRNRL
jgi:hypothetical protein